VQGVIKCYKAAINKEKTRPSRLDELKAAERAGALIETDKVVEMITRQNVLLRNELEAVAPSVARGDNDLQKRIEEAQHNAFRRYLAELRKELFALGDNDEDNNRAA
jgi:hypothetical protein